MSRLPLGIITGTGVLKGGMATLAYSGYTGHTQSRVFGIHGQGLGPLDDSYSETRADVLHWIRMLPGEDTKVVLMGHSQGALHVLRFALDHPDLVDHVILLCGPLDGTKMISLIPGFLKPLAFSLMPAIRDMDWQSDYCRGLAERVQQSWPKSVKITKITVGGDLLVRPRRSAVKPLLPEAPEHERAYYLGLVRPRELSGARFVWTPLAGHLSVLILPPARNIVRRRLQPAAPKQPAPQAA